MIDHLSLQVADVARSRAFYEVLLARLGLRAAYTDGPAVGFVDEQGAPFWILPADLHEPRLFPEYGRAFFGCFVRDPDGHNVEAVCRAAE